MVAGGLPAKAGIAEPAAKRGLVAKLQGRVETEGPVVGGIAVSPLF